MKKNLSSQDINWKTLRYAMFVPLALMVATVVSCCLSYSDAKQNLADDLRPHLKKTILHWMVFWG